MKSLIKVISLIILIALVIGIFSFVSKKDDGGKSIIDNIIGITDTTTITPTTTKSPYTGAVITKNSDSLEWTFVSTASMSQLMYGFKTTLKPNTKYSIVYSISTYFNVYGEEYENGVSTQSMFDTIFEYPVAAYRFDENSGSMIYNESENMMNDIINFTTDNTGHFEFYMARVDNDGVLQPEFTGTEQQIQYHKNVALIIKNSETILSIVEVGE